MTVQELIDVLSRVDDKTLDVSIATEHENLWVVSATEHSTGDSGYENIGTVELAVSE